MADNPKDWNGLAGRLENLAQDMMNQSDYLDDEFDKHIVILWARSLMHSAIEMRFFAGAIAPTEDT